MLSSAKNEKHNTAARVAIVILIAVLIPSAHLLLSTGPTGYEYSDEYRIPSSLNFFLKPWLSRVNPCIVDRRLGPSIVLATLAYASLVEKLRRVVVVDILSEGLETFLIHSRCDDDLWLQQ